MTSGINDCIKSYASKAGCSISEADKAMRTALEVIKDEIVNTGGVAFIGAFSLKVVQRSEKRGVHPLTGEPHVIPSHRTLKLFVGKQLKEELNK